MQRKFTENLAREGKRVREESRTWLPIWREEIAEHPKPKTRGECADVPRPCPYASCRFHLYLDVHPGRPSITFNFPGLELDEVPKDQSCALDIAERGGVSLLDVSKLTNITRERVRQVQNMGIAKVVKEGSLTEYADDHVERPKGAMMKTESSTIDTLKDKAKAVVPDDDVEEDDHIRDENENVSFFDRSARASRIVRSRVYRIYTREMFEKGFETRAPSKPTTSPRLKF